MAALNATSFSSPNTVPGCPSVSPQSYNNFCQFTALEYASSLFHITSSAFLLKGSHGTFSPLYYAGGREEDLRDRQRSNLIVLHARRTACEWGWLVTKAVKRSSRNDS